MVLVVVRAVSYTWTNFIELYTKIVWESAMKKVLNEIKYWAQALMLLIYGLSFLFPRNKKIWVFGSTFGRRFADNPRYLYTYLQSNNPKIRAVWITHSKEIYDFLKNNNTEVYMANSIKGYWLALRGGVYIYDNYSKDVNFWLSGKSLKFNTWHGLPLKKIQMDNKFDLVRHPQNRWARFRWGLRRLSDEKPSDYILTTSEFFKGIFSSAFATKNVVINNYPRIDILNGNLKNNIYLASERIIYDSMLNNQRDMVKNIIYMPTFRDSEEKFFEVINMKELLAFLKANKMVFYVKLHPKSKNLSKFKAVEKDNLVLIDKDSDPYTYLNLTDVLITDYSSIYFDYLVLDKPIIFFAYDLSIYLNESRELYFSYEEFTPGKHVTTMPELIKALTEILVENQDIYGDNRKKIRDIVFRNSDDFGCEAVTNNIERLLKIDA